MRNFILTTLTVAAISTTGIAAASAGDALSPDEMNTFMQKDRQVRQSVPARPQTYQYDPSTTGSILVPGASVNSDPELWPPCLAGPPTCTAAGYPNLRYLRETHGGY